jgi:transcriptional regulator GlxA family with amidase domain
VEDTTWEKLNEFRQQFSDIQLEDELFAQAGRDVMTDLHYSRKRPTSGSV